jgi:hypothetical protein
MSKYVIGAVILVIVLIFASYGLSNNEALNATEVASAITVIEPPYDFGDIDIFGGKVSTTYTLKNEGPEDVFVLAAVTSCMCTEGEIGGLRFGMHESSGTTVPISAGGEAILTATFDPLAHGPEGTGPITRELMLKTNSTVTPEIKVTFTANVVKNEAE